MLSEWKIHGLAADSPNPALGEKLQLFGQFVGDWDILEDRFFQADGTEFATRGEIHWNWILDGRALQDIWMFEDEGTKELVPAGTTIRFYDPDIDKWRSTWISPIQGAVVPFIGTKIGEEIVLEGKDPDSGEILRWIFSNISSDAFTWREERSSDAMANWRITERMQVIRSRK